MEFLQSLLKYILAFLLALLFLVGCAYLLSSCSTAEKLMDKAEKKDPAIVAKYARDKYPCKDLLKNDTAIIWRDTLVYVDCPDTLPKGNDFEVIKYDTVNKVVVKTIRVPVTLPIRTQTITKWYEDSAKLKIGVLRIAELEKANKEQADHIAAITKKINHKTKENWIWRIIASVLIIWQVWKLYKRITTFRIM